MLGLGKHFLKKNQINPVILQLICKITGLIPWKYIDSRSKYC
jgi:hypothetical protein